MKYDGAEFLRRVQAHQLEVRGRTGPTGCWVCDVQVPEIEALTVDSTLRRAQIAHDRRRCAEVSPATPDAHHVLPKRVIRDEKVPVGRLLDELLMDPRNGILVRRFHHDALERRMLAIPVSLLPADTLQFADELGLLWWLENQAARRR